MARVLCASKVEYTLKIKKIVRGGTRSRGTLRRTLPPPVGPAGGQAGAPAPATRRRAISQRRREVIHKLRALSGQG
jgi:hypothetical protein